MSCVVPALAQEYDQLIARYLDGRGALVGPEIRTGMPIRIDNPRELGADRLVNAVAAYEHIGGACIAVDFGTAVNYDVVSGAGEYLGGVIAPGIEISLEALSQRAAALPRIRLEAPESAIGRGTLVGHPVGRRSTATPARSTAWSAACARSWATRRRPSRPAASRPSSRRTASRSTRSTTC